MVVSWYGIVVLVHVLAAIIGLGATFASPFIMSGAKSVPSALYALSVNEKVEKLAKYGSLTLLVSGLLLGAIHPYLFQQGWYILSIVLYIAIQPIVAYLLPKTAKAQHGSIVNLQESESLPEEYLQLGKKAGMYSMVPMVVIVVMVLLMSMKPF